MVFTAQNVRQQRVLAVANARLCTQDVQADYDQLTIGRMSKGAAIRSAERTRGRVESDDSTVSQGCMTAGT